MSRPIDDNWHYTGGQTVYVIPLKRYENFGTEKETVEEDRLILCEECFDTLLELVKESKDERGGEMRHRYNLWTDLLRPWIYRLIGHRYACCARLRNCTKCVRDMRKERK